MGFFSQKKQHTPYKSPTISKYEIVKICHHDNIWWLVNRVYSDGHKFSTTDDYPIKTLKEAETELERCLKIERGETPIMKKTIVKTVIIP